MSEKKAEKKEEEVIILNKPFLGGWLKNGNIGHEIIDYLATDNNEYYAYNNPWGICPDDIWVEGTKGLKRLRKEKFNAKYLVLTSEERITDKGSEFDILYVIELEEKLHRNHTSKDRQVFKERQNEIKDIIREREIKYNGKYLDEIYKDESLYVTFKVSKIYEAEAPIRITGIIYDYRRNKGYLYSDSLNDDFITVKKAIEKNIKNGKLRTFEPKIVNSSNIEDIEYKKSFMDLIDMVTSEQAYTNILHSILKYENVFKDFCEEFKGKENGKEREFDKDSKFVVNEETTIYNGRMDICAEGDNQRVVIENKVNSSLNGVKEIDNITQLSTYYKWASEKRYEPLCFIIAPDYKISELEREIKEKDPDMYNKYERRGYSEIASFIENEKEKGNIPKNYPYYDLLDNIIYAFRNLSYKSKSNLYAGMFFNETTKKES